MINTLTFKVDCYFYIYGKNKIKELNSTNRDIGYNICEGGKSYRSMRGENNPDATRYFIQTPEGKVVVIETRQSVIKYLGCSLGFFTTKIYKNHKLIKKEKINK